MRPALATFLWASSGWASNVEAAQVEAGTLTTVAVNAPLYDSRLGAANGCDPSGCTAALTRVSFGVVEDDHVIILAALD